MSSLNSSEPFGALANLLPGRVDSAELIHRCYWATRWRRHGQPGSARHPWRLLSDMADWPVAVIHGALKYAWINGRTIRRESGRSILRQVLDQVRVGFRHGISPREYYIFGLYEDANLRRAGEYLKRHETKKGIYWLLKGGRKSPLTNKLHFAKRCRAHGLPVVPVLLSVEAGGRLAYSTEPPGRLPARDLFVKPNPGKGGSGAERWDHLGEGRYRRPDGLTLEEAALLRHLWRISQRRGHIVQPRVVNHPEVSDLSNGALCSMRVVTCRNERGGFEVTNGAFRMARGGNRTVDNLHQGGVGARIDIGTGRLGLASNRGHRAGTGWIDRHPDTGALILGRVLPLWPETVALAERAHATAFADRLVIGWDIALLEEGPHLVEGNSGPDLDIIQRVERAPLGNARLGTLLAFALLQTEPGRRVAEELASRS